MTRQTRSSSGLPRVSMPPPSAPAARTATAQTAPVTLGWERADCVLTLIATTTMRGASYSDSWSISPSLALASVTVADTSEQRQACYVSRAVVGEPSLAPDTTYTFSYAIVMRAGSSTWAGSGSVTITVGPDGSLTPPPRP